MRRFGGPNGAVTACVMRGVGVQVHCESGSRQADLGRRARHAQPGSWAACTGRKSPRPHRINIHMHRFYSPFPRLPGAPVNLPPAVARQCAVVLRLHASESIALFDGTGEEAVVILDRVSPQGVEGHVEFFSTPTREPLFRLELAVALPRQDKWEWILQKGTEVGAASFQPIETMRCVARLAPGDWDRKSERWGRILVEAAEQSGRTRLPDLKAPLTLQALAKSERAGVVLHTGPGLSSLRSIMTDVILPRKHHDLVMALGPEGGLDPVEVRLLVDSGWIAASMGPRTLRCETAALVAATIVLDAAGEMEVR